MFEVWCFALPCVVLWRTHTGSSCIHEPGQAKNQGLTYLASLCSDLGSDSMTMVKPFTQQDEDFPVSGGCSLGEMPVVLFRQAVVSLQAWRGDGPSDSYLELCWALVLRSDQGEPVGLLKSRQVGAHEIFKFRERTPSVTSDV